MWQGNDLSVGTARLLSWPCGEVAGSPVAAGGGTVGQWEVGNGVVTLFLCGDVMPGRGVDQVLPHPGHPELREAYASDARAYVDLAVLDRISRGFGSRVELRPDGMLALRPASRGAAAC